MEKVIYLWEASHMEKRPSMLQAFVAKAIDQLPQKRDFYDREIQRRTNSTGKTLYDISRGKGLNPGTSKLEVLAEVLGQPFDLMKRAVAGEDVDPVPTESAQMSDDPDDVALQEWDIAYGMGGGSYLDLPVTGTPHTFSRQWLRNFTHAPPGKIFLARGAGDSMSPTILDADMVIIDTSEREIRVGDKIWAVVYGTTGYIKRIRPMPDGSVKLLSDNPNVPAETAYDGELSVVGRVVAVVRKT